MSALPNSGFRTMRRRQPSILGPSWTGRVSDGFQDLGEHWTINRTSLLECIFTAYRNCQYTPYAQVTSCVLNQAVPKRLTWTSWTRYSYTSRVPRVVLFRIIYAQLTVQNHPLKFLYCALAVLPFHSFSALCYFWNLWAPEFRYRL
jgi:hypothetical protein